MDARLSSLELQTTLLVIEKFCDAQEYTSNNKVFVGNGEKLPISHIGIILCVPKPFSTPNGIIPLKNILCVPNIKKET